MSLTLQDIADRYELMQDQIDLIRKHLHADFDDSTPEVRRRASMAAQAMVTMQKEWGNSQQFMEWVENKKGKPKKVNCWESILYAGCAAGVCTIDALRKIAEEVDAGESDAIAREVLGYYSGVPLKLDDALKPLNVEAGDVLFILGNTHVVMALNSTGGVCSHWSPDKGDRCTELAEILQKCDLTDLGWRLSILPGALHRAGISDEAWPTLAPPFHVGAKTADAIKEAVQIKLYNLLDDLKRSKEPSASSVAWIEKLWRLCMPPIGPGTIPAVLVCTPIWPDTPAH